MKMVQMVAIASLLLTGLFSCSKENEEGIYDPLSSMYETYTGKQGKGAEDPENFFQLKLEDNGSLFAFKNNREMGGAGNWEISDGKFNGKFRQRDNNMIVHLAGIYDPIENKITGTWGYGEFTTGGGSFFMEKEHQKTAALQGRKTSKVEAFLEKLF